ncbi:hypothetical protein JCM11251_002566 [Rhodosporidiobolus azoricus]
MNDDLALLLRHYSALSPTSPNLLPSPPFPSSVYLSLPQTQQWLVQHLLGGDRTTSAADDGARTWKKVFWRRAVKGIEEGFELRRGEGDEQVEDEEVHPDILEAMVDFLSSSSTSGSEASSGAPGVSTRTYYWGDLREEPKRWKKVSTREEGRMISGGTTGLRTWQACIALSNHLIASPALLTDSSAIVELGAGVGLLSLVAARIREGSGAGQGGGAGKIVATDVDDRVLELLRSNIKLNDLDSFASATSLDWELASDPLEGLSQLEQWEKATFGEGERPELILGADIVYDPSLAGHLAATLGWLLRPSSNVSPQALIAGTIRNETTWELFLAECRSRRLRIEPFDLLVPEGKSGIVGAEGWEGEGEVRLVRITAE